VKPTDIIWNQQITLKISKWWQAGQLERSIWWQAGGFEPWTYGLQVQYPNHYLAIPPLSDDGKKQEQLLRSVQVLEDNCHYLSYPKFTRTYTTKKDQTEGLRELVLRICKSKTICKWRTNIHVYRYAGKITFFLFLCKMLFYLLQVVGVELHSDKPNLMYLQPNLANHF